MADAPLYAIPESSVEAMRRYIESLPPQDLSLREEVMNQAFWKAVRTEFLATLLLTVFGCGSCLKHKVPHESVSEVKVAVAFGGTVATLVHCVGPVSGAHLNPMVSIALLVGRRVSVARAAAYCVAQCLGAVAGAAILYGLAPRAWRSGVGLGATVPAEGVAPAEAFGIEFLSALVVAMTVLASTDPNRVEVGVRAIAIGLAYLAAHLFAFPYTGASLNPARSFGPAVLTNSWTLHWIYWVAPVLGGIIGSVTYDYTQVSRNQESAVQRSFRKKTGNNGRINRDMSALSGSNETEMTVDHGGRL